MVINKLQTLQKADLRLNQTIDCIRKFLIPILDYNMQCNPYTQDGLERINVAIRNCINKAAGAPYGTPVAFFYTNWKDGGLSIPELKERQYKLQLGTFLHTTFLSRDREFFQAMFENEMKFRRVPQGEDFCNYQAHQGKFRAQVERGTKTSAIRAVKAAHKLQVSVQEEDTLVHLKKDEEEKVISNTKELLNFFKSYTREQWHSTLTSNKFKGHSFAEMKENTASNFFFSPSHPQVNGNVLKFIYTARTNNLPTGEVLTHGKAPTPPCPKCRQASDTLMHRLNGCRPQFSKFKTRHNEIERIIVKAIKETTNQRLLIQRSRELTLPGSPALSAANKALKPDIWYLDRVKNCIKIIEITVPYDSIDDDGRTKLTHRREEKIEKYTPLVDEIRRSWEMSVHLHVIVVSSLGAVPKETQRELLHLFEGDNKKAQDVSRSLALNAVRESALIYWGIDKNQNHADNHEVNPATSDEAEDHAEEDHHEDAEGLFQSATDTDDEIEVPTPPRVNQPGTPNSDAQDFRSSGSSEEPSE